MKRLSIRVFRASPLHTDWRLGGQELDKNHERGSARGSQVHGRPLVSFGRGPSSSTGNQMAVLGQVLFGPDRTVWEWWRFLTTAEHMESVGAELAFENCAACPRDEEAEALLVIRSYELP